MNRPAVHFHEGVIRVPLSPRDISIRHTIPLAREVPRRRAVPRQWDVPAADAPEVLSWAEDVGVDVADDVRAYAETQPQREERAAHLSEASHLPSGSTPPQVLGLVSELLPLQEVAVRAGVDAAVQRPGRGGGTHRALILADDAGLGKTLEALAILRAQGHEARKAVVVCPSGLIENWLHEMREHFTEETFSPWVAATRTPSLVPEDADVVLVGWSVLADWGGTLADWGPDAVVVDEGHFGKAGRENRRTRTMTVPKTGPDGRPITDQFGNNVMEQVVVTTNEGGSQRGGAFIDLGHAVAARGGLLLALTATPVLARPIELAPLLDFAGIEKTFVSLAAFRDHYCAPVSDSRGRTLHLGATHSRELNARLTASGHYLRRTKEVLVDEGALRRKYVDSAYFFAPREPARPHFITLSPDEMAPYMDVRRELEALFARRIEGLLGDGLDLTEARERITSDGRQNLKEIGRLRHAAATIKVPHVVAMVQAMVDRNEKVVVSAHHRDVVDAYADAFTGIKLQGGMSAKAIERAKGLFNETPASEHPVLAVSYEAGQTGHTLCKQHLHGVGPSCARMILAEQVWTPASEMQMHDRIWRIGQEREVSVANVLLASTVDEWMFEQRRAKRRVVDAVTDARDHSAAGVSPGRAAGLFAWRLGRAGLSQ